LRRLYKIKGLEHIAAAQASGQGALFLSMHFTSLELGNRMLGQHVDYDGMYRSHNNPVYDYLQKVRREAFVKSGTVFSRDNVRGMMTRLRQGHMIWYAPDRDLGGKASLFVPFFGVQASTITATAGFARAGRALVIPFTQKRLPKGKGYELVVHPPFDNFPSGDEYLDALRVNQFMEAEIRKMPGQYFWAQPRFKTRPTGEEPLYEYLKQGS
jgi:Kdo2-lipid IVA lauroyltransferase/acyltransferase